MDLQQLSEQIKNLDSKVWAAILAAIASLIATLLNYINQRKILRIQSRSLENTINEQKKNQYYCQLKDFYYPFKHYLSESARLYIVFRSGLPKDFRTLLYLIDNNYLFTDASGNKQAATISQKKMKILNEILVIEDELCKLIIEKGGIIDDESLCDIYMPNKNITDIVLNFDPNQPQDLPKDISLLSLFMVHCKLMKLAINGELEKDNIGIYMNYVYPRELNKKLDENIKKIKNNIDSIKKI